jgi:hypothetical protein
MLSPALVELNRDAFVASESPETTVDLDGHRSPFPQVGGRNRPRRYSANGSRLHEPS